MTTAASPAHPNQGGFCLGYLDGSASYVLWAFPRGGGGGGGGSGGGGGERGTGPREKVVKDLFALIEQRHFPVVCILGPQAYVGAFLYLFLLGLFGVFVWLIGFAYWNAAFGGGVLAGGVAVVVLAVALLMMTSYSDPGFVRKGPCPGEYPLLELEEDIAPAAKAEGIAVPAEGAASAEATAGAGNGDDDGVVAVTDGGAREGLSPISTSSAVAKANPSAPPELSLPSQKRANTASTRSPPRTIHSFNRRCVASLHLAPVPSHPIPSHLISSHLISSHSIPFNLI